MRRDMIPLAAGLSLFALGFGVPSVMYAVMDPSPELPGLYSFRSQPSVMEFCCHC